MVSLKTQATASNQGFTLVELIVVITILAILGTIGFISLSGYSAQSRDTKRTTDLRSITSSISVRSTQGLPLSAFVTADANLLLTVGSVSIAGTPSTTADLLAGIPNYVTLGLNPNAFKDGNQDYKVGVTLRRGGAFQVAGTAERIDPSSKSAITTGTYVGRTVLGTTSTSLATTAVDVVNDTILLAAADIGKYRVGDTLGVTTGGLTNLAPTSFVIRSITADGLTLRMATDITAPPTSVWTIVLGAAGGGTPETLGLIRSVVDLTTPVVNASTTALPY